MDTTKDHEFVRKLNKRLSEVQDEEERRSKHSSTASETDSAILETSVTAAVVENVKTECFATLEAGNTVRLSVKMPTPPADRKESCPKQKQDNKIRKPLAQNKTHIESTKQSVSNTDIKTSKGPVNTVVPAIALNNGGPDKIDNKHDENLNQIDKIHEINGNNHDTHSNVNEIDANKTKHTQIYTGDKTKPLADSLEGNDGKLLMKKEKQIENDKSKQNVPDTTNETFTINQESGSKTDVATTSHVDSKTSSVPRSKKSSIENQSSTEIDEGKSTVHTINSRANSTITNIQPTSKSSMSGPAGNEIENSKLDEPSKGGTDDETTVISKSGEHTTENASANVTRKSVPENETIAEPETQVNVEQDERSRSPEILASLAKQLTTGLAKQMVDATSKITSDMVGASTNSLTLYNGSTLELADIDYFVIYKSENPMKVDGISFIARMELGTNAMTKVIPVSPVHAWISYSGGGVKLIDTEKESVINKIDIPDLDAIAAYTESVLFTSSLKSFSQIEKTHIIGEGCIGTTATVKIPNSRIACFSMADSGKMLMACIEKRHGCCCIPGKSEIIVQKFQLHGKRVKEYKPKVNGQPTLTAGFPIVMCENINKDICIASYNSADHTCAVEVFDRRMERKFIYDGDKTLSPRFMCEDLCCDKNENVLMLDNSLKCVHIVNRDGKLVKLIYTSKYQIENPKCINVDVNGKLWIGQGPPAQMILLEYEI